MQARPNLFKIEIETFPPFTEAMSCGWFDHAVPASMCSEAGLLGSDILARVAISLMSREQWHDAAALLLSGLSRGFVEGIAYGYPLAFYLSHAKTLMTQDAAHTHNMHRASLLMAFCLRCGRVVHSEVLLMLVMLRHFAFDLTHHNRTQPTLVSNSAPHAGGGIEAK